MVRTKKAGKQAIKEKIKRKPTDTLAKEINWKIKETL